MIESDANGEDPLKALDILAKQARKLASADRDEFLEHVRDVRDIMTDYFQQDWGDKAITFIRRNKKNAEHEFEIELAPGIVLEGKMDALGTTRDKRLWLVENKSFNKLPSEDHRWRNLQSNVYHRVNDVLGWPKLAGLCWNYICNRPPGVPKLLKNGQPSLKRLNSLPSKMRSFLEEHDFKERHFPSLIKTAESNQKNYFIRVFSTVRKSVVEMAWKDLIETANIMADTHGKRKAKTIGRHCDWCEYEPICRAEFQGADVDFIIEKEYYRHGDEDAPIEVQ